MRWRGIRYGSGVRAGGALVVAGLAFAACEVDDEGYAFGGPQGGGAGTSTSGGDSGAAGAPSDAGAGGDGESGGSAGENAAGGAPGETSEGGAAGAAGTPEVPAECTPDATRPCSEGGFLGSCGQGVQTCTEQGTWGACDIEPAAEDSCAPDNDDNCNGIINDGCPCVGDETRPCAEAGARGACAEGTQQCAGGVWQRCSVEPAAEDGCAEGDDATCNGLPNEGCDCLEGETRSCADGGLFGKCETGTQECAAEGAWDSCSVTPSTADTCEPDNDDNCNGTPNEGCLCINDVTTRSCGDCDDGTQVCTNGKTGQYGACSGATAVRTTYYRDADGDGWGSSATTQSCSATPPDGYVDRTGDCCDSADTVFPGQSLFFGEETTACGVGWDYDCSGEVETNPVQRGTGCASGTTYPACESSAIALTEASCGATTASCGCGRTSLETCMGGCGGTFQVKCH